MSSQSKSLNAMTLLVLATAVLFSAGFLKGVEGRKLLQEEETFPSEDILEEQDLIGEEYAMAMAPAPAPAPTMMTMEEESIVVEGEGEVPAKRRRSLLQELGNGPVPSGEEILGEIYDIYDEMFAPAPAPATTTEEEEAIAEAPSTIIGTFEITTITGTITAAEEDHDPDMTGPN